MTGKHPVEAVHGQKISRWIVNERASQEEIQCIYETSGSIRNDAASKID